MIEGGKAVGDKFVETRNPRSSTSAVRDAFQSSTVRFSLVLVLLRPIGKLRTADSSFNELVATPSLLPIILPNLSSGTVGNSDGSFGPPSWTQASVWSSKERNPFCRRAYCASGTSLSTANTSRSFGESWSKRLQHVQSPVLRRLRSRACGPAETVTARPVAPLGIR